MICVQFLFEENKKGPFLINRSFAIKISVR